MLALVKGMDAVSYKQLRNLTACSGYPILFSNWMDDVNSSGPNGMDAVSYKQFHYSPKLGLVSRKRLVRFWLASCYLFVRFRLGSGKVWAIFWIAFGYVFDRVCIGSIYVVAMCSYVLARFWLGFG